LYKIEVQDDGSLNLNEDTKELAMSFDSPVMKVEFCAAGKLLAVA